MPLWNSFKNDARVLKEAETLQEGGFRVIVFALEGDSTLKKREVLSSGVEVRRLWSGGQRAPHGFVNDTQVPRWKRAGRILKRCGAQIVMLFSIARQRPDIVHAHDVNTLPLGYLAARLCRARIVYDAHEFATEREGYKRLRRLIGMIERYVTPRLDGMISTSDLNAKAYARRFKIPRPTVLANMPRYSAVAKAATSDGLRGQLDIPSDQPIILYQGGLQPGRGLFLLVDAMAKVDAAVCVIMGDGRLKDQLVAKREARGLHRRIRFHAPVPLAELPKFTASADIGVHPLENSCANHRWASPNKLYEYVHAGLPVVASDLAGMREPIETHRIGLVFEAENPADLARCLNVLLADRDKRQSFAENSRRVAPLLSWETQEVKLLELYKKFV